jgi:prophage regulatory protein
MATHSNLGTADSVSINTAVFMRLKSVMHDTGLARSTIYKLMAAKEFPAAVRLTARAVGWRRADVERWSASRPSAAH